MKGFKGFKNWSLFKKDIPTYKQRMSAPPMSAKGYNPNANREEYLQAFDEYKQRRSMCNQSIKKETESGSQNVDTTSNKCTDETEGESSEHHNIQSKSVKTKLHSFTNKMSRSLNGKSHKKTNTPTSTLLENNNSIYVNEISDFEDNNCTNDSSFGAVARSPPKTFYRENSNPYPSNMKSGISGIIDQNFGFLYESQFNDDDPPVAEVDKSPVSASEHGHQQQPIYTLECKIKDIKPTISRLKNTLDTPFVFSSGSFRRTDVTLKKGCPNDNASTRLVEEAMERDYEILSKVKHPNIIILMAACFHKRLISHMTLVLEPVDCTIYSHVHHNQEIFTVAETLLIGQQIATAVLYLHESGFIHSNISSHNVLFRLVPFNVKLSSFELATDVYCAEVRDEIEEAYPKCKADQKCINIPSKYLIYDGVYRESLSMYNWIAPELQTFNQRFVYPTKRTDVYSICLLLWEILNRRIPLDLYKKSDVETMIAEENLKLPFYERKRCFFFVDIFRIALAVNPKDRVKMTELIEMFKDIELGIATHDENSSDDSDCFEDDDNDDDDHRSSIHPEEPEQLNGNNVNSLSELVLSPGALGFNKALESPSARTSTRKLRPRKLLNHPIRELFNTAQVEQRDQECRSSFAKLEESIREISNEINRNIFDDIDADEKLSESLAVIAEDICRNILDDTDEVPARHQPEIIISKANESSDHQQKEPDNLRRKLPVVVGYSVKAKKSNDSKTCGNFLERPDYKSGARKKLFNSPEFYVDIDEYPMPSTSSTARENYIRRNAWLSYQQPSSSINDNKTAGNVKGNNREANPSGDGKKINVSVRIVHNHITPKKSEAPSVTEPKNVDEGRPSILSKIQFFNSANEATKAEVPRSNDKRTIVPVKPVGPTNHNSVKCSEKSENRRIVSNVTVSDQAAGENVSGTNEKQMIVNELRDVMLNLQRSQLDQSQQKQKFENKLWKQELNICNKSLNSSDAGNGSKVLTSNFPSIKATILKFEKRGDVPQSSSSSDASPTELVKSFLKTNATTSQQTTKKLGAPYYFQ